MSDKIKTLSKIQEVGIVAVVRAQSVEQAEKITDACIAGGVAAIELTFTVPHADELIEAMCAKYSNGEIIIGAGTVMDAATARIAILAGAEYIVAPYFDPETVKTCNRYGVPSMPGIYTPTEAVRAMECGADVLKIFPGDIAGTTFIKDIHGPIPNAVMMPSGGVDINNVKDWIKAGAVAVGAGSSLIAGAKTGDYNKITETGKIFVQRIKEAREEMAKK
ncbi:MAG: bifunctional 2-keto-4-hydroxyglutarate aldolase/2-keto-3-deoxy-6-phosphogluconate aldolase [Clostridiales bacterium]|nr:bifunctional 2-keto-4-hydroxyglutarate aldolase/2-keto-3-deoxy-6-phosphogluconate aldolase [Clostridiales bacterium]